MPIYSFSEPDFFDRITTRGMEWVRSGAAEIGWEAGAIVGGDPKDESSPVVIIARVPPGGSLTRHAHDAYRIEIQLFGSLQQGDRVLRPGDVSVSAPGEFYGPSLAGPEGSVSAEFISSIEGIVSLLADESDPEQVAQVEAVRERVQRHRDAVKAAQA